MRFQPESEEEMNIYDQGCLTFMLLLLVQELRKNELNFLVLVHDEVKRSDSTKLPTEGGWEYYKTLRNMVISATIQEKKAYLAQKISSSAVGYVQGELYSLGVPYMSQNDMPENSCMSDQLNSFYTTNVLKDFIFSRELIDIIWHWTIGFLWFL